MNDLSPTLGRRGLFKLSGGLVVAFSLFNKADARAANSAAASGPIPGGVPPDAGELSAWLAVHPDNTVTLYTGKVDVGTGAETALAQIAAEELYFPIDRLNVVMGTTSVTVNQGPSYGSRTIRYAGPQIRHAAAAGKAALLDLAAKHFKVEASELSVTNGIISVNGAPSRAISYGKLVDGKKLTIEIGASGKSFDMVVAPQAQLKDPATYTIVGTSVKRKDIPAKITAEYTYIQDLKVPGMLHGRVVRPYGVGATLLSVDETGLKEIPGFVQVVRRDNFLGVVAETEWGAIQAAQMLGSVLDPQSPTSAQAKWSDWNGLPEMDKIWDTVRAAPGTDSEVSGNGDVDAVLKTAAKTFKATFQTPFQMHGSIGPSCAVVDVKDDSCIIYSGSQMPHEARHVTAKLLGIPADRVELIWYGAPGAYGRNGLDHAIADAAIMSQLVGRPVRVQWMRWDEHGWEPKGPAIVQDLEGAVDEKGNVIAWRHHMWLPTSGDTQLIAAALIGKPDIVGSVGLGTPAVTYAYQFPNTDVANHAEGKVALLTAWLRSPAQFETTFAMESFIDEMAAETGQDPIDFRLKHLSDPRAIAVLQAAAKLYGWEKRPAGGKSPAAGSGPITGRGVAWVNRDDARVATIADVTVDPSSGQIRVTRVVVAHDCGLVINPDGLKNQIEGNIVQSISRTLHEEVTFDRAHVTSRDWFGYPILRFSEVPDSIDIVFVNNTPEYPSYGGGEPATCPTAAVISNAVFDAIGVRLRQTPFRPERVKATIA